MCNEAKKCGPGCSCGSCGSKDKGSCKHDSHPMMVRLFETLERMEEEIGNINDKIESIGAGLYREKK